MPKLVAQPCEPSRFLELPWSLEEFDVLEVHGDFVFEMHLDVHKCIYCWVLPLSALRVCMHASGMFEGLYPHMQ